MIQLVQSLTCARTVLFTLHCTLRSDGKKYHFLLQFNGSYYARVDEHCAQLHYVTNKVLRKGLLSSRKNLSIKSNVVIPIAQRLRLIADDMGNFSLDSVISSDLLSRSLPNDSVQKFFKNRIQVISEKKKTQVATELHLENDKVTADSNVKLAVYHEICDGMVKNNTLSKYIYNALQSLESMYAFRKRFAVQWAIESLLQYAFNVVDRTPSRLVINIDTGQVVPTEFRISYNNQGLIEGNKLPFRITRNIENLVGPFMIGGLFVPAMASGAEAFNSVNEELNPALCVILRDDIVSWYCSKSPPRSDSKNQELERQLGERILKNASLVQRRMLECAPDTDMDTDKQDAADSHLRHLLHVATSPENLCEAPLPFQPWF
jgi:transformation/transcription domain-associated protein